MLIPDRYVDLKGPAHPDGLCHGPLGHLGRDACEFLHLVGPLLPVVDISIHRVEP